MAKIEGLVIGIDFGTGSSKGVLARLNGEVEASSQVEHRTSMPRPGHVEHDAEETWWVDFMSIVQDLLRKADGPIVGITTSGIGPCSLFCDASGAPLRPAIRLLCGTTPAAEPVLVDGELRYLHRALQNLVSNAMRHAAGADGLGINTFVVLQNLIVAKALFVLQGARPALENLDRFTRAAGVIALHLQRKTIGILIQLRLFDFPIRCQRVVNHVDGTGNGQPGGNIGERQGGFCRQLNRFIRNQRLRPATSG